MSEEKRRRLTAEDLYRFITPADPRISPDGELIAFVRTEIDQTSKEPHSSIWMLPAEGGTQVQFTRGTGSDTFPRWSPDSQTLAFVSDRGGVRQIWLIDRFGGEARPLTQMRFEADSPVWSPDGRRIAFTSPVGPDDPRELLTRTKTEEDKKAEAKRTGDEARAFTRMEWRADAGGILPPRHSQIWVISVPEPGEPASAPLQVTWGDFSHADPDWSPDGQRLAFSAKRSDDEHAHFYDVHVCPVPTLDSPASRATLATPVPGAELPDDEQIRQLGDACCTAAKEAERCFQVTTVTGSAGVFHTGRFSPDGKTLAILGHLDEYMYATLPRIWLFPLDGGEPRQLAHWDLSIENSVNADVRPGGGGVDLTWAPDGNMIFVPVSERGACSVYGYPVAGGKPQLVAGGNREISAGTFDQNCETLVFVAGDQDRISDLFVMDCREFEEQPLTDLNGALFAELELPVVEELSFRARDGWDLHGWLMKPVGFEPDKRYPLVLQIHGGPHTCYGYAFSQEFQLLAAAGYAVLFINPRGSSAYGQAFADAVRGSYGTSDYADLMDAVDYALTRDWIDPSQLAVTGGSYGGYMTNWIVTQTDRFAAAISHRSISNWVSFSGTPDFGPFFNKAEHKVDDPWSAEGAEALWQISPLRLAKNVRTPLSLMQSEADYRCPIEQAEQFYMAIKYYQQAPVELVRHPRSNHDLTRQGPPTLRVDRFRRILKWLATHCPAEPTAP